MNTDQSWFWTPEWQQMEAEADQDLKDGKYEEYPSCAAFIRSLEEQMDGECLIIEAGLT